MTERDITFYDWNEPVRPSETHETAPSEDGAEGAEADSD